MKNYIPFTVEDMYFANNVDLVHVLKSRGEEFENLGEELRMKSNPNIFLKGHMWYDASTQEGGLPVEFMKKYCNMNFQETMSYFLGKPMEMKNQEVTPVQPFPDLTQKQETSGIPQQKQPFTSQKKMENPALQDKPAFQLPNRNDKMSRTFAYLTKGRKLDYDVISHFAKTKTLYESCEVFDPQKKAIHNAVFVGTDENGVPKHAHKHGLSSYGESFKQNIVSSDSAYSFHHVGTNDRLFAFEAPIDMMSFISMYKQDWQESSYVALCGVGSNAIQWMTSQFPQIQRLCLCLDNDQAGMEATNSILKEFEEKGIATQFLLPQAKDWNEDLVNLREQEQNQNFNQGAMVQGGYAMGMQ